VVEIQEPEKPSAAPWWIGILIIIVGITVASNSVGSGDGVPSNLEVASAICGGSLLIGLTLMCYYVVLERKHSSAIEKKTATITVEEGIAFPPKVSIIPLLVSICFIIGPIIANDYLSETEFWFHLFGGLLLLIYYLVLIIKRGNELSGLNNNS